MRILARFCVIPKRGAFTDRARDLAWIASKCGSPGMGFNHQSPITNYQSEMSA
jgi:hypothetical protein